MSPRGIRREVFEQAMVSWSARAGRTGVAERFAEPFRLFVDTYVDEGRDDDRLALLGPTDRMAVSWRHEPSDVAAAMGGA